MITSIQNNKVKKIEKLIQKSKTRTEEGLFVVEGLKMMKEVPADRLVETFMSEAFAATQEAASFMEGSYEVVSEQVFKRMSDVSTPQGILGLVKIPDQQWSGEIMEENPLYIMAENLQDPGNIGTLIRTAEAAGADGVFLSKGCADLYNPKVVRSTMGSIFRIRVFTEIDPVETIKMMKTGGIQVLAAHLKGAQSYDKADYCRPTCILIGNEGSGLTQDAAEAAGKAVKIPLLGGAESLNAAVAAGVLLYEAVRQRGN